MATIGFSDLKDTALPALWDADLIQRVRLAQGASFESLVADIRAGLTAVNRSLLTMPHYSELFSVTTDVEIEYPIGVSAGFEVATEYSVPDPRRGKTTGHMLPIEKYDRSLGWTMMYLREARAMKLQADIRSAITDAPILWQQKLLTRFFLSTGNTVGTVALADNPFADGGTANSTWVPLPSPEGETFAYTHSHLIGYSNSAVTQNTIDQSAVEACLEHLQEHGHKAPYDAIVSRTDLSSWANTASVTGWKPINWAGIMYHASAVERAALSDIEDFVGYIETDYGVVRVWSTPRLPTLHAGFYKAYGKGDPRNPLRVRYAATVGFGFNYVPGIWVNSPMDLALMYAQFGVGVGEDRTNGVLLDVAASSYTSPTIS